MRQMRRGKPVLCTEIACRMLLVGIIAIGPAVLVAQQVSAKGPDDASKLCLDDFCIGQGINDSRFDKVDWIVPHDRYFKKKSCEGVGCTPQVAFRGYPERQQEQLAEAVSWIYELGDYNIVAKDNLAALRVYRYECNPSARGIFGERRFFGAYRSIPSHYLTVIGLRLIDGELKVYRIARQYPYHTQAEIGALARTLRDQYGRVLLLYEGISSNAYSDVVAQGRGGWFGRSTMFNPADLSNNAAELVLIDPRTRSLLEPSSMPESGEIRPLPATIPPQCNRSVPIQ